MLRTALLALLLAPLAVAQEQPVDDDEEAGGGLTSVDEERLYDDIVARLQREQVQLTALVQVGPRVFPGGEEVSRFDVQRARLGVRTQLGGGFGFRLQTELSRSPALLDAYLSYHSPDDALVVDLGRHNVPFAYETLTSASRTDFVRRSLAERAVSPGRSVGASARARLVGEALTARLGVLNAALPDAETGRTLDVRDRGGLVAVARLQTARESERVDVVAGAGVGYETPNQAGATPSTGRALFGADARLRLGRALLAAEVLGWRLDSAPAGSARSGRQSVVGGHVTAGLDVTPRVRALARLDALDGDASAWAGVNVSLTRAASVQADLVAPLTDGAPPLAVLVNAQVAF